MDGLLGRVQQKTGEGGQSALACRVVRRGKTVERIVLPRRFVPLLDVFEQLAGIMELIGSPILFPRAIFE